MRWRPIAAVAAIATLFTAMQGLSYPLLAVVLDRRGAAAAFIGLNTAMMPLGMILAAPFAAPLMQRLGARALAAISISGAVAGLMLIGAISNPWAWMPLRLLLGFWLACLFVVSDTWMIELATEHARGRVLGLYSMLQSVGFAVGPALLLLVGTQGWAPFLAGAACGLLSFLSVRREVPRKAVEGDAGVSTLAFVSAAPILLAGIAAAALADQVTMSLLPIFTLRHGLDVNASNFTLIVMIAGTVGFQLPVGWLADHTPGRALYLTCAVWTAVTAALLPVAVRAPLYLWLLVRRDVGSGGPRGHPVSRRRHAAVGADRSSHYGGGDFCAARCGHHAQLQMVGSPLQRCASPGTLQHSAVPSGTVRSGLDSTMAPSSRANPVIRISDLNPATRFDPSPVAQSTCRPISSCGL